MLLHCFWPILNRLEKAQTWLCHHSEAAQCVSNCVSSVTGSHFGLTKVPHAFLVRVIQEKVALLDGPVNLEAETQARILHQVRQDVLSQALVWEINQKCCCASPPPPPGTQLFMQCYSLLCTSSLLLSRLDIETSSIFICQNYQMSRRCCGHAVEQQSICQNRAAEEVEETRGGGSKSQVNNRNEKLVMRLLTTCTLNAARGGDASQSYNLRTTQKHNNW